MHLLKEFVSHILMVHDCLQKVIRVHIPLDFFGVSKESVLFGALAETIERGDA